MKPGALAKAEREKIFRLFLKKEKAKFSEIEKALGMRSNSLAYHLEQMQKQGVIEKSGFYYSLTGDAESYLPLAKSQGPGLIVVVLVAIMKGKSVLLAEREERPHKGRLGLIGGKMLQGETIHAASERIALEKAGLPVKFRNINKVAHELIARKGAVRHSFLLILTTASLKDKGAKTRAGLSWASPGRLSADRVIPSDLWLIKNGLGKKAGVSTLALGE